MRNITRVTIILIAIYCVDAQANYPHGHTTTNPIVGGLPMFCQSWYGQNVVVMSNHYLNDVGMASTTMNGQRVIQLNPNAISHHPPIIRQFWFAHECAHHMLYPASNSESNADFLAVKALFNLGVLNNQSQLLQLAQQISQLPGTLIGHLPGLARLQNMLTCVN